mgnify:CR=1 FL=1
MRRVALMLMLLVGATLSAQDISVSSFKMLENDLTANTTGTMERDQNGEVASLIKVVTPEQGFVFDGGMVGIVKTRQEVGEVWVYVPHGIKRITIRHPQLGVLRDYYFPIPIEKARTYEMKLTTGRVETVVTHSVNKQFVVFSVNPTDAVVELDDEMLSVDSEGYATKGLPYGTYSYRVSCANYHTEAGQVTVTADRKAEVNITLRPNFGWIRVDGNSEYHGAYVYIDNERVGKLPFVTDNLKSGVHQVKIVKSMYKSYERQITVQDNETTELNVEMTPNFSTVTLTTDDNSEIWIDGERRGKGQWTGPLEIGNYTVEVKKASHRTVSEMLSVNTVGERTVQLTSPTPIYALLEISSTPLRAKVYIDGVKVGETPLLKSDVLVGQHRITLEKDGYVTENRTVELNEGIENTLSVEMKQNVAENKPTQSVRQNANHNVPQKSTPDVKKNSLKGWRGMLAIEYSGANPINYGGELGISYNRFSLSVGAKSHFMGYYGITYRDGSFEERQVQLLRFSTKIGYTMGLGKFIRITPQVGLVYGPSYFIGQEYITGEILQNPDKVVLYLDTRAESLNRSITQFAKVRYGVVAGARFELGTRNAGFGVYATPEYLFSEGLKLNVGLVFRF